MTQKTSDNALPDEYVFCDPLGGAWGCDDVSQKTPIALAFDTTSSPVSHERSDAAMEASAPELGGSDDAGVSGGDQARDIVSHEEQQAASEVVSSESSSASAANVGTEQDVPNKEPVAVVVFNFDEHELLPTAKAALQAVRPQLAGENIEIHGYTDNVGTEHYNDELGLLRAAAVADFLTVSKTEFLGVQVFGQGRCCYLVENATEEGRQRNRRAEIYVVD